MASRRDDYDRFTYETYTGPNMEKADKFPNFRDGDVEVVLTQTRIYQLHRSSLINASPTMRRLLADAHSAKLCSKAIKKGVVIRNRVDATVNADESGPGIVLAPVKLDEWGESKHGYPVGLSANENGLIVDPIYPVSVLQIPTLRRISG